MLQIDKRLKAINNSISLHVITAAYKAMNEEDCNDDAVIKLIEKAIPDATCVQLRPIIIRLNGYDDLFKYDGTRFISHG